MMLVLGATAVVIARPARRALAFHIAIFVETAKRAVVQHMSDVFVGVFVQLTSEDHHVDRLLKAFSDGVRKAVAHDHLRAALKDAVIEGMRFEQLHNEIVGTLTGSMITASRDKGLRGALLSVLTEALRDEGFMTEMLATMTDATISASKNRDLRDSVLNVAKSAITDAMKDEGFVADVTSTITSAGISAARDEEVRETMVNIGKIAITDALRDECFIGVLRETFANSLRDGSIYRGAALGVVGALNPFSGRRKDAREIEEQKEDEEEEGYQSPDASKSDAAPSAEPHTAEEPQAVAHWL